MSTRTRPALQPYAPNLQPYSMHRPCTHSVCICMQLCAPSLNPYASQNGVLTLNIFGYINALTIMLAILIWARVLHNRLQHNLIYDPLTVFHDSTEDMDTNEVATLYGILDKNGDEQVTVETIVRALMVDMYKNSGETNMDVKRKQEAELVALCKKKIAEGNGDVQHLMHREAFESHYKNIFGEALAWKIRHDAMRKKGSSLMDGIGGTVRRISGVGHAIAYGLGSRMKTSSTSSAEFEFGPSSVELSHSRKNSNESMDSPEPVHRSPSPNPNPNP